MVDGKTKTFSITTLGCRVNQYESQQVAELLRTRGWRETSPEQAVLCIVNSCSVTNEAAAQSRQMARRLTRLGGFTRRVLVMGCWATSHPREAAELPGVDTVLGHGDNVAEKVDHLLNAWSNDAAPAYCARGKATGTTTLPLLNSMQTTHQRAYLKIQDGCDAHCTYCIIPKLRPRLWSKPIPDVIAEARQLVAAGHQEIVLTGIFLGAYGQSTALHRRQSTDRKPLIDLIAALCKREIGLRRLRLSSLEPADLTEDLLGELSAHPQVMPHFHLPLQSGCDVLLHRMNRQYRRQDFLKMVQCVRAVFDRPAITTDIIVGFPGEGEAEFAETLALMDEVRFLHIHAFPFSARPGTAAARWLDEAVPPPVVAQRREILSQRVQAHGMDFQRRFIGQEVEILVEHTGPDKRVHGRCERYFDVTVETTQEAVHPGRLIRLKIDRVTSKGAVGTQVEI